MVSVPRRRAAPAPRSRRAASGSTSVPTGHHGGGCCTIMVGACAIGRGRLHRQRHLSVAARAPWPRARRRAPAARCACVLKPVAMTVMRTSSPAFASMTEPKMMFASGSAASAIRLRRLVDLVQRQVGAAGDVDQDAGGAVDRDVLEQRRADRHLRPPRCARLSPVPKPVPISARPMPVMIVRTSAKSTLMRPGDDDQVADALHGVQQTSSAMPNASSSIDLHARQRRAAARSG